MLKCPLNIADRERPALPEHPQDRQFGLRGTGRFVRRVGNAQEFDGKSNGYYSYL